MTVTVSETYAEAVVAELRAWTARRGLRQADLADLMGVTEMWISRRFRGRTALTIEDLARFAETLEVGIGSLLPPLDVVRAGVNAELMDQIQPSGDTNRYMDAIAA